MTYRLITTARAKRDRDSCYEYIAARNPDGACCWLGAYEDAARALLNEPHFGEALESEVRSEKVRQKMFRTSHGRTYRILYVIRDDAVYILHVRGPGQNILPSDEVELPEEHDE